MSIIKTDEYFYIRDKIVSETIKNGGGVYYNEGFLLETEDNFAYFSDPKTYELYYINHSLLDELNISEEDYYGKKCYKILRGKDEPCQDCTNNILSKDSCFVWESFNHKLGKYFIIRDKFIEIAGRNIRFEVAMDSANTENVTKMLIASYKSHNVLVECIKTLIYSDDFYDSMHNMLGLIGEFYKSESTYVIYFGEKEKRLPKIYHWKTENKKADIGSLEYIGINNIRIWMDILRNSRQIIIKNIYDIKGFAKYWYEYLSERGINNLCSTGLYHDGKLVGIICIENIAENQREVSFINTLSMFIASELGKHELEHEHNQIMYYDPVTKYMNFVKFKIKANEILKKNDNQKYSLWYCDIKNFKFINDVLGYDIGNSVLKFWADFINYTSKSDEAFTRVSADNFVILRKYESESELEPRFRFEVDTLEKFEEIVDRNFKIEIVAGVYLIDKTEGVLSIEEMMNRANIAQKSKKRTPGSSLVLYNEQMRKKIIKEMEMEANMQEAIANGEFILHLQPQVNICNQTGKIRAEVLIRWIKPNGDLIMPSDFIPLFERDGLIVKLDLFVFEESCKLINKLLELGKTNVCISINVSRISMLQSNFVEKYCRIKKMYCIPDGMIELEFTENIVVENHVLFRNIVSKLKKNGFFSSIDDFGSGQSSLNVLKGLPMDVLKIDRLFFCATDDKERDNAVIASVIHLAKSLRMRTVAEGIEDIHQVEMLSKFGCDYIQGFVFAKPMPVGTFLQTIDTFKFSHICK